MDKDNVMRNRLKNVANARKDMSDLSNKRVGKEKLKELIQSYIKTVMIGELSKFEAFFGNLWGHGLMEEDCTEKQKDCYEIWQQCRHEILNFGNKNVRDLLSKIDSYYEIVYKGNSVKMYKE